MCKFSVTQPSKGEAADFGCMKKKRKDEEELKSTALSWQHGEEMVSRIVGWHGSYS